MSSAVIYHHHGETKSAGFLYQKYVTHLDHKVVMIMKMSHIPEKQRENHKNIINITIMIKL